MTRWFKKCFIRWFININTRNNLLHVLLKIQNMTLMLAKKRLQILKTVHSLISTSSSCIEPYFSLCAINFLEIMLATDSAQDEGG
jgi:hypothetical protein